MMMKKKLDKMKMPEKRPMNLDLGEDESPNMESLNSEEGQDMDKDMEDGESADHREKAAREGGQLHTYSDDELIAEVKKRGLVRDLEEAEQEGSPAEEASESPEEEKQEDEMNQQTGEYTTLRINV